MAEQQIGSEGRPLRVAVVGSGPSAFYAVEALCKAEGLVRHVDVFERLPTPFGLVRGGVAPDHQKIKSVVRVYEAIAAHPDFRFFGNVLVGRDVGVGELLEHYDDVVLAIGSESDRRMGVPGEDLAGVHSATSFVGWYNGHPDFGHFAFDLPRARRVAVVGNGNVAIDVTRILVRDPDELAETDIAHHALVALRRSRVEEVLLLGRRGAAQAAFSPKEIQEVAEVAGCDLVVDSEEVELDEVSAEWLNGAAPRSAHRNLEFLRAQSEAVPSGAPRRVRCRFLVSPTELIGDADGHVTGIRLQRNRLVPGDDGVPRPRPTGEEWVEDVQLVLKAIGYRGVPLAGVPFDERNGIVPNESGRVIDPATGAKVTGLYVVGWAKRGPTGLIGTNSPDSKATVKAMLADLQGRTAPALAADDREAIPRLLRERGVDYVTFGDWQHLDRHELELGRKMGKVRHKLTTVTEMLAVIRNRDASAR